MISDSRYFAPLSFGHGVAAALSVAGGRQHVEKSRSFKEIDFLIAHFFSSLIVVVFILCCKSSSVSVTASSTVSFCCSIAPILALQ